MFCFIGQHPSKGITNNQFFNNASRLAASALSIKCNQLPPNS